MQAAASEGSDTGILVGAILGPVILVICLAALAVRYKDYRKVCFISAVNNLCS